MARSHRDILQGLERLAQVAVPGTLVEVYLRCGTKACGCHRDPDLRHGPNLYLKFRSPKGHSTSLYVPRSHEKEIRQATAAWTKLRDGIAELGNLNREALRERVSSKGKKKSAARR